MSKLRINLVVWMVFVSIFSTSALVPYSRAAIIGTSSYLNQTDSVSREKIENIFTREDVRKKLVAYGVDPDDAVSRVAAMNEEELRLIQANIDDLPAGEGILAVLGVVLVVLIVLELVGVTNVFNHL